MRVRTINGYRLYYDIHTNRLLPYGNGCKKGGSNCFECQLPECNYSDEAEHRDMAKKAEYVKQWKRRQRLAKKENILP